MFYAGGVVLGQTLSSCAFSHAQSFPLFASPPGHPKGMSGNFQTSSTFHYRPLDPGRNEIRLLRFLPALDNGVPEHLQQLSCLLEYVSLDDDPTYAALSYVFGGVEPPSFLGVNGEILPITLNLEVALRHLQSSLKSRHIWIDAVCINERDAEEKSVQVPRMCSLYEHAEVVIAWLGPSVEGSDSAMQWINDIGQKVLSYGPLWKILAGCHDEKLSQLETAVTPGPGAKEIIPISPLIRLFRRGFWRRVWIMQEVAMAKTLIFKCGRVSVAWHPFFAAFWLLQKFHYTTGVEIGIEWGTLDEAFSQINFFLNGSYLYKDGYKAMNAKQPLRTLLEVCRQRTCASDPRDMVFALSGLAADWEQLAIRVDYSKEYEEIFTDVARAWVRSGDLNVLFQAEDPRLKSTAALPSWVPDWTRPRSMNPIASGFSDDRTFSASGTSSPSHYFDRNVCQSRVIVLDGVQVGDIASIGQVWNAENMGSSLEALRTWLEDLEDLSRQHTQCRNASDEAIWQVPIAFRKPKTLTWRKRGAVLQEAYQILRGIVSPPEEVTDAGLWCLRKGAPYIYSMNRAANQRRVLMTNQGHIGLGPHNMRSGDLVCILLGSEVPLVLRQSKTGKYTLVGDAYLYGVMHGEYMEDNPAIDVFEIE